ncbi:MAG: SRPBCC family protein [Flavobacteriaceae bacterium]|nr:SRPBCC family protein [Flavobacteriaceae bacterium]
MNLNTAKINVKKKPQEVYLFLTDLKNFEKIMPENIDKFELVDAGFLFALKGMPTIKLKLIEKTPNNKIILGSTGSQFPFTLTINMEENNDNNTLVNFNFESTFNAMVKMMVKKPLQKFINTLSDNLEKLDE